MTNAPTIAEIGAEVEKLDASKSSTTANILLLAVSISLFAAAGLIRFSMQSLLIIMAVLFIHEAGHWLGMKCFGYRDLKMFFIPFLGAGVTGKERASSGTADAVIILLGPVPGIILGIGTAFFCATRDQLHPLLIQYAEISVGINLLNMLPFFPLDGGRFFEAVLFSRWFILETAFKLLAGLGLAFIAWDSHSILLGVLALLALIAGRETYFTGKIARRYKKKFRGEAVPAEGRIPHEQLERLMPDLALGLPGANIKAKMLAVRARNVWGKIRRKAPGILMSLGMLACYGAVVIAGFLMSVAFAAVSCRKATVVQRMTKEGATVRVQETYFLNHKIEEAQLNSAALYDGPYAHWRLDGKKETEGSYENGYMTGVWNFYDGNGDVKWVITYAKGIATSYRERRDGIYVDLPRGQWANNIKDASPYPFYAESVSPHDMRWLQSVIKDRFWPKQNM